MVSNPLSYESLKAVLQYTEANKRFEISRCCPSIRSAERAAPLNIDYLEFEPGKIKINETTYSIGIYKKFHVGEAPEAFKVQNDRGGVMFEVDKFGIEDWNDPLIVTPGDIEVGREFRRTNERHDGFIAMGRTKLTIEDLEGIIQCYEDRIARGTRGTVRDEENAEALQQHQASLIPLLYERDNAPTPFENLIQVNVTSEGSTYIERYLHNKKYHEAVKQLGVALFGGRKQPINVKNFSQVGNNTRPIGRHIIIRLPVGVQFRVRGMRFSGSVDYACNVLSPIIHESSYPLDHLHVEFFQRVEVAHPIVQSAKMLTFSSSPEHPFETLLDLTNRRINIRKLRIFNFSVNVLKSVFRFWIRNGLPIGTHFTFEMPKPNALQARRDEMQRKITEGMDTEYQAPSIDWINELQREFNGVAGISSVIIPIDADTQLVVSHKESFDADSNQPSDVVEVLVETSNQQS